MINGFNPAGLCLVLLALGLGGIEVIANKWIKKITNTYWLWLLIGVIYLIYCISVCWWRHWSNISVAQIPWGTPLSNADSSTVSLAFMLNICPFANFALCVTLVSDPSRKAARVVAPIALVSSIFVLFVNILPDSKATFSWQYIFFGTEEHPDTHYSGHVINMLISLGVLLNTPKLGWKGTVGAFSYTAGFYAYTATVAYSTGAQCYVSGVNPKDFIEGTYKIFDKLFPGHPEASMCFFFSGVIVGLLLACILIDICKRKHFAYGDKYSGCWWKWYDYEKTTIKEPWGWFSHNWQLKHSKIRKSIK